MHLFKSIVQFHAWIYMYSPSSAQEVIITPTQLYFGQNSPHTRFRNSKERHATWRQQSVVQGKCDGCI